MFLLTCCCGWRCTQVGAVVSERSQVAVGIAALRPNITEGCQLQRCRFEDTITTGQMRTFSEDACPPRHPLTALQPYSLTSPAQPDTPFIHQWKKLPHQNAKLLIFSALSQSLSIHCWVAPWHCLNQMVFDIGSEVLTSFFQGATHILSSIAPPTRFPHKCAILPRCIATAKKKKMNYLLFIRKILYWQKYNIWSTERTILIDTNWYLSDQHL